MLLDVVLPGEDSSSVRRAIRRHGDVLDIMLSDRTSGRDVVGGLEAGADDSVTKPAAAKMVFARIRALLRRVARIMIGGRAGPVPLHRLVTGRRSVS